MGVIIDSSKCVCCGKCVDICPGNIIRKNDENLYSTCTGGMEVPFAGDDYNDCLLVRNGYIAISSVFAEPVADKSLCAKSTSQFVL